jgi:hypothetical protein
MSGGLHHAYRRFETDYWGASYAAGAAWLLQNVQPNRRRKLRVANCGVPAQTTYYLERSQTGSARFKFVDDLARADYLIATTRDRCNEVHGQVLHTIDREDVPLLFVIQLTRPPRQHHKQASHEPRRGQPRGAAPAASNT